MQCFTIPINILKEIEKVYRSFFWGQKGDEKKVAWVALEKMHKSKREGGMGFRNMHVFNRALLAKQAWRVITNEESLMAKVLKGKYFPAKSFMEATVSPNSIYPWRSILSARDVLSKGARIVVSDGSAIRIWEDPGVPNLPNFRVTTGEARNEE
ncbi:uncharacterized mitochondrial protein AtMg00310-like [Beta vulgaris subsp. vulgaris]|uniref:uncharacterized mitochondrial protein AtMg00310-like n=1 Tax=Beta vulgaris subsp. vulgaris TaxID=3555 RepID=UPI000901B0A7|nr:uncharacterized mitochondrial protein AtMg00310-like [Beta vulgaris subsp. vulgaris]